MSLLPTDDNKYERLSAFAIVDAFNSAVKDLVRKRLYESGGDWRNFVASDNEKLVTKKDFEEIESRLLEYGYRFQGSASISAMERPDAYVSEEGSADTADNYSINHPEAPVEEVDGNGRELRGIGDNTIRTGENITGTARYIPTTALVLKLLNEGVPADTIAIIDDSGGTLTAPILEQFKGVICAGGTVRSHLSILTREYNIPCLMNSKIGGIKNGDRLELETTADIMTSEAYSAGAEINAHIWRLND